jgi:hypothetical protein
MRPAFVVRDGVDFVDDDRSHPRKVLPRLARGEQNVERLRRGDQDVRRTAQHGRAIFGERVAGADTGPDFAAEVAARNGQLLDLAQRRVEVLLHVVGQRLERRAIDDLGLCGKIAGNGLAQQAVDAHQEGGERLAGAGGRRDQRGFAAQDRRPAGNLRLGRSAELRREPLLHDGVRPGESRVESAYFSSIEFSLRGRHADIVAVRSLFDCAGCNVFGSVLSYILPAPMSADLAAALFGSR